VGCSALQETVTEAAGGGADIEAGAAGDVDLPVVECCLKFETAAADEGHVVAEKADGGVRRDGGAGLVDFLFVHENAAGEDQSAGTFAAGDESAFNEKQIDAGFDDGGQGFDSRSGIKARCAHKNRARVRRFKCTDKWERLLAACSAR
jgi:hypothetical protein